MASEDRPPQSLALEDLNRIISAACEYARDGQLNALVSRLSEVSTTRPDVEDQHSHASPTQVANENTPHPTQQTPSHLTLSASPMTRRNPTERALEQIRKL